MKLSARRHKNAGFTLIEVLIAAVIMAIILMGLISSLTGSFMSASAANRMTESQATARRLLEEACELSYADMLLLDGGSLITTDGIAVKCQVYETSLGLLLLEVEVCRPADNLSPGMLAAMSMAEFHEVPAINGSRLRFTTLSTGRMERATVTDQTTAPVVAP